MDTSGTAALSIALELVVIAVFAGVVARPLWRGALHPVPWFAIAAVIVVGVPSLLQFALPGLGAALARSPELTLRHGQWWRVATALLAQDGGLAAAAFNLVVVAVVALIGGRAWGQWAAAALFLGCSLVLNLAALHWQPGGGTSFASDGLLAATAVRLALLGPWPPARWGAAACALAAVVLVAADDAHGVALLLGFAAGAVLTALVPLVPSRREEHRRDGGRDVAAGPGARR